MALAVCIIKYTHQIFWGTHAPLVAATEPFVHTDRDVASDRSVRSKKCKREAPVDRLVRCTHTQP